MNLHRSLAGLLAAGYVLLVVYASLYPFAGWVWPASASLRDLLLAWPPWRNRTDEWANLVGYVPLGLLWFAAVARHGGTWRGALALAVLGPSVLSYTLELLQHTIPGRFPSLRDWLNNSLGAASGAVLGALAQAAGLFDRWQRLRERWITPRSSGAVFLLMVWPLALLFPSPVVLGLGRGWSEVLEATAALVSAVPWAAEAWPAASAAGNANSAAVASPLPVELESLATACGLLVPCALVASIIAPGWRRSLLSFGAAVVGAGTVALATALNFGPDHAWAFVTPATLGALLAGLGLSMIASGLSGRVMAVIGLLAVASLVSIVSIAPADPYYAASLERWEQGRFVRFHGLAQWLAALWPYLAGGWFLLRALRRR